MLFWRIAAVVVFLVGSTVYQDFNEYRNDVPLITEIQRNSLYKLNQAPEEIFTNGKPNLGIFSEPIRNLNQESTSYIPMKYRLKR
jgi:hypothetical protein